MKKAIIFLLGVITGRYLITFVDRLVSVLFYGNHDADYIPFTKQIKYTKPFPRSYWTPHYSPYRVDTEDSVIFDDLSSAEEALNKCIDIINEYGHCKVSAFKGIAEEITKKPVLREYSDYKFGWKNLKDASISRVKHGYKINLPEEDYIL